MRAVINSRYAEACAGKCFSGKAVCLDDFERRFNRVGKHKARVLSALDFNCASGIINKIALRRSDLLNGVASLVKRGNVNFAISIGSEFLRVIAADFRNTELSVGEGLVGLAVKLGDCNSRLEVIEKNKVICEGIALFKNDFLRGRIDNVAVLRGNFLNKIGAGVKVIEKHLAFSVGHISADERSIAVNLKLGI